MHAFWAAYSKDYIFKKARINTDSGNTQIYKVILLICNNQNFLLKICKIHFFIVNNIYLVFQIEHYYNE